nr:unnamed protein product [Callosobruchus analis]
MVRSWSNCKKQSNVLLRKIKN